MPLKKSALLLILLSTLSLFLLVLSPAKVATFIPADNCPLKCSYEKRTTQSFAPWMILSKILFLQEA
jgi:hypothetical protein